MLAKTFVGARQRVFFHIATIFSDISVSSGRRFEPRSIVDGEDTGKEQQQQQVEVTSRGALLRERDREKKRQNNSELTNLHSSLPKEERAWTLEKGQGKNEKVQETFLYEIRRFSTACASIFTVAMKKKKDDIKAIPKENTLVPPVGPSRRGFNQREKHFRLGLAFLRCARRRKRRYFTGARLARRLRGGI